MKQSLKQRINLFGIKLFRFKCELKICLRVCHRIIGLRDSNNGHDKIYHFLSFSMVNLQRVMQTNITKYLYILLQRKMVSDVVECKLKSELLVSSVNIDSFNILGIHDSGNSILLDISHLDTIYCILSRDKI